MHVVDASAVIWRFEEKNSLNFANVEFILPPSHTHTPTHISVWLVYVFLSTRYINNWCWYISCCFIYELHSEKSDKSIIIYIFCTGIYYILTEILRNNKTSSNKLNNDPCCRFVRDLAEGQDRNWFRTGLSVYRPENRQVLGNDYANFWRSVCGFWRPACEF